MATKAKQKAAAEARRDHQKAMGHPLRRKLWVLLYERGASSPKELSDAVGVRLDLVSHHVKRLAELGCAELVDKRQVRGAIEHFYVSIEPILLDADEWNALYAEDPVLAKGILGDFMSMQIHDFTRSIQAGTLGTDEQFLVDRNPIVVDSQGADEVVELFDGVELGELVEIVKRSKARRAKSGEPPVHMAVNLAIFKTPAPR
jgi:DNA-binding transcriptional ArsR family regulator